MAGDQGVRMSAETPDLFLPNAGAKLQNTGATAETAIREALAAGPTPGVWVSDSACGLYAMNVTSAGGDLHVATVLTGRPARASDRAVGDIESTAHGRGNQLLITACNPAAITELLAELDRLRATPAPGAPGQEAADDRKIVETYEKLHEGKLGAHWLWCVIEQIAAGVPEAEAFKSYGYYEPATDPSFAMSLVQPHLSRIGIGFPDKAPAAQEAAAVQPQSPELTTGPIGDITGAAAVQAVGAWQDIATAPDGVLVIVGWRDKEDAENPDRHMFDYREEGVWANYFSEHEHYSIAGVTHGLSEDAPYTHWMPMGPIPAALPAGAGEKTS